MEMVDKYFELQQRIYDYFKFQEDFVVLPLDDRREYNWIILNDEEVQYSTADESYSDEIYKHRFYKKWVYREKDYTMIMVDTKVDNNRFLAIFDNSKEIKE